MAKKPGTGEPALHFDNREDLEAWLKTQPREVAVAIAARAALRVLPLAALHRPERRDPLMGAALRATALALVVSKYPIHADQLRVVADASARAAYSCGGAITDAAAYAADAASSIVDEDLHYSAAAAVRAAANSHAAAYPDAGIRSAVLHDAAFIGSGHSPSAFALRPLWPDTVPEWAEVHWLGLRDALPREDDWQVWIDWYQRRLDGVSDPEEIELVFATVPEEKWNEGPAAANRWIKQRLEQIKSAEIAEVTQFGDAASSEVRNFTPLQLPQPLVNVPSPFAFGWNSAAKLTIVAGPHNVPVFPFSASEKDHAQYIEACRAQVQRLLADWSGGGMNVRSEYGEALERYRDDLPPAPGAGNIMLADAEARILREMFEAEADFLPVPFASRLKIFLQLHMALRNFYPEVERFYIAVRSGRLEQPLPQDAVKDFERTVRDNTPGIFDPEVSWGLREVARQPPLIEIAPEDIRQRTPVPFPPHDPLGELEPQKSRSFERASSINSLYEAFLKGKDIPEAVAVWSNLAQKLGENAGPVIEWLKNFVLPS